MWSSAPWHVDEWRIHSATGDMIVDTGHFLVGEGAVGRQRNDLALMAEAPRMLRMLAELHAIFAANEWDADMMEKAGELLFRETCPLLARLGVLPEDHPHGRDDVEGDGEDPDGVIEEIVWKRANLPTWKAS